MEAGLGFQYSFYSETGELGDYEDEIENSEIQEEIEEEMNQQAVDDEDFAVEEASEETVEE